MWERAGGKMTDDFFPYLEYLVQFKGDYVLEDTPEIIYSGSKTLAAKVLGDKWNGSSEEINSDLDLQFRSYVAEGYRAAVSDRQPVLDVISSDLRVSETECVWVTYSRLIFPMYLKTGKVLLASLALPLQPIEIIGMQDLPDPQGNFPHTKGRGGFLLDSVPSARP